MDIKILIDKIEDREHRDLFNFTMDKFLFKNQAQGQINVNIPHLNF